MKGATEWSGDDIEEQYPKTVTRDSIIRKEVVKAVERKSRDAGKNNWRRWRAVAVKGHWGHLSGRDEDCTVPR